MADNAQKEPTMEEILASIRKIIADDDPGGQPAKASSDNDDQRLEVNVVEDDNFDDLSLDDVLDEVEAHGGEPENSRVYMEEAPMDDLDDDVFEDFEVVEPSFSTPSEPEAPPMSDYQADVAEDLTFEAEADTSEPEAETAEYEDDDTQDDVISFTPEFKAPEPMPEPEPVFEPQSMEADAVSYDDPEEDSLTDSVTATAAAGAFGKLMAQPAADSAPAAEKTPTDAVLEGLVRELMRPMVKSWLDENLSRIVEEKVEEEVQRISRKAR